jgi:hypothetical protein
MTLKQRSFRVYTSSFLSYLINDTELDKSVDDGVYQNQNSLFTARIIVVTFFFSDILAVLLFFQFVSVYFARQFKCRCT